jgi:hypothetical protein
VRHRPTSIYLLLIPNYLILLLLGISGELPEALPYETIAPLEKISLRGTRISGPMPDLFCKLNIGIDVSNTDLAGCIPDCYQQLVTQNKFTFSGSKLTWCLPPSPFN